MRSASIFTGALLAASALAAPSSRLADRIARRARGLKHDPSPFVPAVGRFESTESNSTRQTDYPGNWAGAVIKSPPGGTSFNRVSGYFTVPYPNKPGGANGGDYAVSAWAGIDGDTYGNAILQAGCDSTATNNGPAYDCWYEWFPNPLTDFDGFVVQAGDNVYVNLVEINPSEGTATLTNTRTGQTATQTLYAPNGNAQLAGQNAEWIVEDFSENGGFVPFANFGSVTFSNCQAFTGNGQTLGTSGATIIDMSQNGQTITDAEIPNDSSVTVRYTGP